MRVRKDARVSTALRGPESPRAGLGSSLSYISFSARWEYRRRKRWTSEMNSSNSITITGARMLDYVDVCVDKETGPIGFVSIHGVPPCLPPFAKLIIVTFSPSLALKRCHSLSLSALHPPLSHFPALIAPLNHIPYRKKARYNPVTADAPQIYHPVFTIVWRLNPTAISNNRCRTPFNA